MAEDKMDDNGMGITMRRPLLVEVVLKDKATGKPLLTQGEWTVEPGDSIVWTLPGQWHPDRDGLIVPLRPREETG